MTYESDSGLRSVDRVCDILEALAASRGGDSLTAISKRCHLAKGSTHRYLTALEARGYVERSPDGTLYRLGRGLKLLQVSHLESLTERSVHHLEKLRDQYGYTANLGLLENDSVVYLAIVESAASMRIASRPGDREPLHCTALGKALLATMPEDQADQLIAHIDLTARTDRTITKRSVLKSDVQQSRLRGYAIDDCENEVGGRCVAVALPGDSGAAISMSAPAAHFSMDEVPTVAEALMATAKLITE
ncbi:hypothetical protein ASE12_15880 [Aeromicrobium sp. Root236]|uniref:IclR family transcriptional regulator n=1 Tax=Aeromicrobium sp. Root236 TaxID=1736498 RepID=UPI0006FA98CE|nr:IclR family transcriptional regulator [Aeromicrobium sp. Root236]KRC66105.1 hypothetical protein ASE12_15880 [Aeromicrobium sp. Root236]